MANSAYKQHIFTHRVQCEDCSAYIKDRKADMLHKCTKQQVTTTKGEDSDLKQLSGRGY